jgi:putative endonuclease
MFYVYVLQSERTEHLHTGFTAGLEQRVGQHNAGITKSTRNRGPWKLVYQEQFDSRAEAMRRDKFLKSGKGREQIAELIGKQAARLAQLDRVRLRRKPERREFPAAAGQGAPLLQ